MEDASGHSSGVHRNVRRLPWWLAGPLGLSRAAELTLGIALTAAVLWLTEAVPLFVTSLGILALELVLLPAHLGTNAGPGLFLNSFLSDVSLLFLGGFVLSAGIQRAELDRLVAKAILKRAGRSPTRVVIAMMALTALLGVWMSNTAACALMLGLSNGMLSRIAWGDGFRKSLLLGIAYASNLSGLATPVSSPPNAIVMRYLAEQGSAPSFARWMVLAVPLLLVLQVVLVVFLSRRFPSEVKEVPIDDAPSPEFGKPQRVVTLVFLLTVFGWVFGGTWGMTSGTVALLPVVVFFGTNLLRTSDLRALPWDVVLLIGGGLALGTAVDQSGLALWAGRVLPIGTVSPFVLEASVAVLAVLISSVMSNTAAINLIAPIVMGIPGVAHARLLLIAAFACTLSMPMPMSTPPNALVYGFSARSDGHRELSTKDMLLPGIVVTVIGLVLLALFSGVWFPLFL